MTHYWNELEGVSLAGRYWLKQCVSSTADDAWYLTRFDIGQDAAVRALPANLPFADEQLAVWRDAIAIDHPNIVHMFDAGRTEAEGVDLIYAVCEYPDDFLAAVLRDRPLSAAEAREVLTASLAALSYLHDNQLVHGAVDPSHIMAFGDRVKLPSDTIRRAGRSVPAFEPGPYDAPEVVSGEAATPASDMWSLGITLHEILTQQTPNLERDAEFLYMAEPFATILRRTLKANPSDRWTVRDVEAHLNPPAPKPIPVSVAEPAAMKASPADAAVSEPPAAASRVAESTRPGPIVLPPRPQPNPNPPLDRGFPIKWVPIAGLVAAVSLSAFLFRSTDRPKTEPANQAERTAPAPAPPPVTAPKPAVTAAVRPAPVPEKPRAESARSDQPAVWRVVAFTYATRAAAEKKAHSINEKNPEWHAAVFSPKGDRAPFYISLAGRMTYEEAQRLQKKARSKGLPRDTFVRNFKN